MAKQALIEQRPWLLASVVAATAFYFLRDNPIGEGTWGLLAKGASVGLLALYVLLRVPRASIAEMVCCWRSRWRWRQRATSQSSSIS